jgi:aspartate--ammonia ligase
MATLASKAADLAGPGIGDYEELQQVLPSDYRPLLDPKETQRAIFAAKHHIEENLCRELNLMMVTVPLIVDTESGVNDLLDRDGSRTPIQFHIANDHNLHPLDAQVVQAATKWKRMALRQFGMQVGEGLCTDMRAVRKDYSSTMTTALTSTNGTGSAPSLPTSAISFSSSRSCAASGRC